jgi:predicted dehydrogenase/threonine dehydrogenase-like Zn-dependent dehydrogenase
MKQLLQNYRTGEMELVECPTPKVYSNGLVVKTAKSLISVGTEKMLVDFGKASFIQKAKQQPDQVKQVINKIKTDGLINTFDTVWNKLNDPIPLGYSNVGRAIKIGESVSGFKVNDRIVTNGSHADFVHVSQNLAVNIPDNVSDETAAFTVTGSIAMQGVRLAKPELGETIVVLGLGLLGLLTTQILLANGCQVIGIDLDRKKVKLANDFGALAKVSASDEENVEFILGLTNGIGADKVIITASSPAESILSQCALMTRQRGKIVLVGVIPIAVPRSLMYKKEIEFQVSSSYGPGRYDPNYEEKGQDYPLPFVRWTAKRNMQAFLFLLSQNKINVDNLITHHFDFENVLDAYKAIDTENPIGIILHYSGNEEQKQSIVINSQHFENQKPVIGFIGAGSFAKAVLFPALKNAQAQIEMLSASDGAKAVVIAKKFSINQVTNNKKDVFEKESINTVFIANRHNSHAGDVITALQNGKHVFVEKPLALSKEELNKIKSEKEKHPDLHIVVGFNRRFSKLSQKVKKELENRSNPISIIITVNAGYIPSDHWAQDIEVGGGRIIGEACHFIDLARFFIGHTIKNVYANAINHHSETNEDKIFINLQFEDGSHAVINYLANGNKKFPKERIEVFSSNRIFQINNFKELRSFGSKISDKLIKQDKGHYEQIKQFLNKIENGEQPLIPFDEIYDVHVATLKLINQYKQNKTG